MIELIFRQNEDPTKPKNHKKLVFIPRDPCPIQYMLAKVTHDVIFGCPALWKLSDKIEVVNESTQKTNNNSIFKIS
jgi:hypothetical protein